jgi:tetratricopeptide (TPR) repeat protein
MALLAHAAMDFDFGMMSIFLLLWILVALLNSGHRTIKSADEGKNQSISLFLKVNNYFSTKRLFYNPVVTLLISAAVLFVPLLFTIAYNQATKGVEAYNSGNLDKALSYYSTAKTLDPIKPQYKIDYANLLTAKSTKTIDDIDKGDGAAKEAERWGSNENEIVSGLGDYYLKRGDIVKGLRTIDKSRKMMPLSPNAWEHELIAYYQVIKYYEGKGDNASTKALAGEALKIIKDIENDNNNSIAPLDFNENSKKVIEEIIKYK